MPTAKEWNAAKQKAILPTLLRGKQFDHYIDHDDTAKEWNAAKQTAILPTLLRGKLVDHYIDLDDATKADLQLVKTALMEKTGLMQDPLTAGKLFMAHCQQTDEKVADFAVIPSMAPHTSTHWTLLQAIDKYN